MTPYEFFEHVISQTDIAPTKVLKQHWRQHSFSYRHKPRPDYGLLLIIRGRIEFVTKTHSLSAHSGDLIFLPKHCHYEAVFHGEVDNYLVNFDTQLAEARGDEPLLLLENTAPVCEERFRQLLEERYAPESSALRMRGLLFLLLDTVTRQSRTRPGNEEALLARAQALLTQEELSVGEIARMCCISESGLRRLFRARLACSPAQYRAEQRLRRAAYLLESTDIPLGELADSLNFFDAAYFCKVFQRRFGMTPRQYARGKRL